MGKFCVNCGKKLQDNADYCLNCGSKTDKNNFKSNSYGQQAREFTINHNIEDAFNIVLKAIEETRSFKVADTDANEYIIRVNVGMSMFSWGEKMTIWLEKIGEEKTIIYFDSRSKLGTEIVANSKNKQNIQKLINVIENYN